MSLYHACYALLLLFRRLFSQCVGAVLALALAGLLVGCGSTGPRTPELAPVVLEADKRQDVLMTALSLLNTPYRYGGSHPAQGFDCSGLVYYSVSAVTDARLPRTTKQLAQVSRPISRDELTAGDLVFFNTLSRPYSHVGIYLGDGHFINAPSSGGQVRIDSLDSAYFSRRFDGARTLFER